MATARMIPASQFSAVRRTRFVELGYQKQGDGNWRFIDLSTGSVVGMFRKTERQILDDLENFAAEFGCHGARPTREHQLETVLREVMDALVWHRVEGHRHEGAELPPEVAGAIRTKALDILGSRQDAELAYRR
jgi:hypothetical protein